jgi:hypothetical protein
MSPESFGQTAPATAPTTAPTVAEPARKPGIFTRWRIPALATAALLLAACGGNGGTEVQNIEQIAESVGCESPTPAPTEELYVQNAVECADGSRVLTFAHNQARDDFVEIAEGFGGVYETGENYAVESP